MSKNRKIFKRKPKSKKTPGVYDVVSVGRPAHDVILSGDVFKPICKHGTCYEHIELGAKLNVQSLSSFYGGNALNASVTFSRQKLTTALLAQVGIDSISTDILHLLSSEGISLDIIHQDQSVKIAQSTIILAPNGERVVLAYPGSAPDVRALLNNLQKIETRWLYVSSLGSLELLQGVLGHAKLNQIKVAFNPGGIELGKAGEIKELLESVEVLIMNKSEAALYFGNLESNSLALAAAEYVPIAVITDGKNGTVAASAGKIRIQPISEDVEVIDRNGAGDAFSSGLIAGLASGLSLNQALQLGAKNATSVVSQIGAQTGILRV